jgi:hypothetical protein
MSNTFAANLMPRIIADSRLWLRKQARFLGLVNHDFSDAAGKVGQVVTVPIPTAIGNTTLTADRLPPAATDLTFATATLTLDQAIVSNPFTVEQIHLQNYQIAGPGSVLQQQINAAIDTVVAHCATNLQSKYYMVPSFVGTAGSSFFDPTGSAPTMNGLADIKQQLFTQLVPPERPIHGIFGYKDFTVLRKIQEVRQAYSIGTPSVIQDSQFPSLMGIGMVEDYFGGQIHTVGTITTGLVVTAAQPVGDTSLVCTTAASTGACALKKGDIVTVTGYNYALTADATQASAASSVTLLLDRGLEVIAATSAAVILATNFGTGRVNLAGDLLGASVVSRLPSNPADISEMPVKLMGEHFPITDPVSGLSVLLSFYGQYFQRTMQVSLIYGTSMTDPRRLTRALSANA